jgi:hypothetical protein
MVFLPLLDGVPQRTAEIMVQQKYRRRKNIRRRFHVRVQKACTSLEIRPFA